MRKFLLIVFFSTCACFTQAQVWNNYINGVFMVGAPDIYSAVEDSSTHTLYIGGYFSSVNQYTTHGVVKFDGVNFDTLQSGMDDDYPGTYYSQVRNMVMYKNKLYVFGIFNRAGHTYSPKMAVWNGSNWEAQIAAGAPDFAFMDNDEMYVWGFDSINGMKVTGLARFDGTTWYDVPTPHTPGHTADYVVKFQGKLYKSGQVTPASSDANLSYSDGINWIPWVGISGDANKAVFGMKVIDTLLFVYGRFNSIAGTNCKGFAAYNGTHWFGFGQGLSTGGGWETVQNIQKINGDLYVTGLFDKIEGIGNSDFSKNQSTNVAKFDWGKWCIISPPVNNTVLGIVHYKNDLYMYGGFEKIGNDTVRSIGKYNGGFNEICSQPIAIQMSTVGITEIINFNNIKIYPNPVKDKLTIEFTHFDKTEIKLDLINSFGEIILTKELSENKNESGAYQIDLSELDKGIYFLRVKDARTQKVFKVVKH